MNAVESLSRPERDRAIAALWPEIAVGPGRLRRALTAEQARKIEAVAVFAEVHTIPIGLIARPGSNNITQQQGETKCLIAQRYRRRIMADAQVTITGGVTRDVELRFTQAGKANASFGLAVGHRYKQGETWVDGETSFFNIVAWGQLAENAASCITKGMRVTVTGRLTQRSYETKDGDKRSVVELVADDIGASIKWATVSVERTERVSGDREDGGQSMQPARPKAREDRYVPGDTDPF